MTKAKLLYFFRPMDKFLDLCQRYSFGDLIVVKNEPLFEYSLIDFDEEAFKKLYDAEYIIISSEIALCALRKNLSNEWENFIKNRKFLLVGKNLYYKAVQLNLNILCYRSNIEKIIEYIDWQADLFSLRNMVYLRGNYISFDLKRYYDGHHKIALEEIYSYKVDYKKDFSEAFLSDLHSNCIDGLVFLSRNSYVNFEKILLNYKQICGRKFGFDCIKFFGLSDFFANCQKFIAQDCDMDNLFELICAKL